jgi:hypothetical protein
MRWLAQKELFPEAVGADYRGDQGQSRWIKVRAVGRIGPALRPPAPLRKRRSSAALQERRRPAMAVPGDSWVGFSFT